MHTHVLDTPETRTALSESVTTAFLLVLERLAPKERAAFLLHDVFDMGYEEIAASLEISEQVCRKLVSRARANVRRTNHARAVPRQRQDQLVSAFKAALATGSTDNLAKLLSAEATLSADSGGKVIAIRRPLEGSMAILDFIEQTLSPAWRGYEITTMDLNAGQALVVREDGRTVAVISFAYDSEFHTSGIFIMRNPDKLACMDRDILRVDVDTRNGLD